MRILISHNICYAVLFLQYFIAGLHTTEYLQHALDVTSLECKKKEIQVLNSIPDPIFRDETKEALLVCVIFL